MGVYVSPGWLSSSDQATWKKVSVLVILVVTNIGEPGHFCVRII